MGRIKPRGRYRTISLPNDLYEEIFNHVKKNPSYSSAANFIRIAVREKFDRDYKLKEREKNQLFTKKEKELIKNEVKESLIEELKSSLKNEKTT